MTPATAAALPPPERKTVPVGIETAVWRAVAVFRLLGQLSGSGFPAWVPATLAGMPVPEMVEVLERLVDWNLLDVMQRDQVGRLRYRLHDLLALYAREQLDQTGLSTDGQTAKAGTLPLGPAAVPESSTPMAADSTATMAPSFISARLAMRAQT